MTVLPTVVGVYRSRNAQHAAALVRRPLGLGWRCAWWALDEIADELAAHTVGVGAGAKIPLLQEAIALSGREQGALVLADDDIVFRRGSLPDLVDMAERAGLGICQPAHVASSHVGHGFTRVRRRSRVRLTTFVESGPLVVIDRAWVERVLPLPVERRMGWGMELEWTDLRREGCRLGIVDTVTIEHLGKVATDYDDLPERERLLGDFARRGISGWRDVQRELAVWRPWQRRPPWLPSRR